MNPIIENAALTMNLFAAKCIERTWKERTVKEEMDDDVWDLYRISAETYIAEGITLAYYYPTEIDDGWMQLEIDDGVMDVVFPVRYIAIENGLLNIYFDVRCISFKTITFDDDEMNLDTNAEIIGSLYCDDGNDCGDEPDEGLLPDNSDKTTPEGYQ